MYWIGFFSTVLAIFISTILYLWYRKLKRFNHIPMPKYCLPIFGHALRVPREKGKIIGFNKKLQDETKESKVRVLWISFLPLITSTDVRLNEEILKSMTYINKGNLYFLLSEWLGSGLVLSSGNQWKFRRHLLTPAFHFDILKSNANIIHHYAKEFVIYTRKNFLNKTVEIQDVMKTVSMAIISEAAMGARHDLNNLMDTTTDEGQYVKAVENLLFSFTERSYKPWLLNSFIYRNFSKSGKVYYRSLDIVHKHVKNVIESRIKESKDIDQTKSQMFLDLLINAYKNNKIDVKGIIDEVNTFMFAGHDTTSGSMSWVLYLLGRNEHVQNRLYDEIKEFEDGELTFEKISTFVYLDAVIKETLRLHPPVGGVSRYFEEDTIIDGRFKIPAGSNFVVKFYEMHRDESYWESPLLFNPERFLNEKSRNPYVYVPFSAGPRNCIGQRFAMLEMKIVLLHLLKRFCVLSTQEEEDLAEDFQPLHTASNGIWINFFER